MDTVVEFESTLVKGTLLKRYKRFLADINLENDTLVTAFMANTGPMTSCLGEHWPVYLSHAQNPKRKLKYTVELISNGISYIGVNTHRANTIVHQALTEKTVKRLASYDTVKKEVKVKNSRFDFLLTDSHKNLPPYYLEVKSVTLKETRDSRSMAFFPDTVTERGLKHLKELTEMSCQKNLRTGLLFLVQREDVEGFSPSFKLHRAYAEALQEAHRSKKMDIFVYQCKLSPQGISIYRELPLSFME